MAKRAPKNPKRKSASFHPTHRPIYVLSDSTGNLGRHMLTAMLTQFPPDLKCAWEFRHASWFDAETYDVLRTGNAALCIADTEEGTTPLEATADFGYMRLRVEGYDTKALKAWVERLREVGKAWSDAYVFFKHEGKGEGPKLAAKFRTLSA